MGKDDRKREPECEGTQSSNLKRHRERSFEIHLSDTNSYQRRSFQYLHNVFSSFGSVDVRIFKSSERRLALINFRPLNVEVWDESEPVLRDSGRYEDSSPPRRRSSPRHASRRSPSCRRSRSPQRASGSRAHYSSRASRPASIEPEPINDPKATRTLFVGSLEPDITDSEVREAFERYGVVEQIDIKHPSSSHAYAFVRFVNVDMAILAKNKMSGNSVRSYHCKIGFGKPLISNMLYISGLDNWRDAEELECFLNQFGTLVSLDWQYRQNCATATFQNAEVAEEANQQLKALALRHPNRRLMVDFKDMLQAPRQSSLIPLPTAFPMVPELISGLRPPLPFQNPFVAAALDLMRGPGNSDNNASAFAPAPMEETRQRRPARQNDSTRHSRPFSGPHRRSAPSSRYGGCGTSPIDSLLRPDMNDTYDPVLSSIVTMPDLEAFLRPHLWSAQLYTKKSVFQFRCLYVVGDKALAKELPQCAAFQTGSVLRFQMPQQARTEAAWMADAVVQINAALCDSSSSSPPPFSILLALSDQAEVDKDESRKDDLTRPLTCLVAYLRLKQRAAFLTPLPSTATQASADAYKYTLLLLAPSSFSLSLLKFSAPRLSSGLAFVDDFLVLLLLRN
ncbi:unnamed protein product [Mesocestoides corti]|uniref:RRM domain-containing protein n=1 Tax=Mesocestoides corti TaxID=53468 RepID=A0A0R3U421_MESCO|nr:unnamed protein product [Mesocestoides corti]